MARLYTKETPAGTAIQVDTERNGREIESVMFTAILPGEVYGDVDKIFVRLTREQALVLAKIGRMHEFAMLQGGGRPVFVAAPFTSYCASQLALHGIFSALYVRETTGRGQSVETSLVQAAGVYDIVNWLPGNPMIFQRLR